MSAANHSRAQHSVQADKGGLRRPFRDSAPKAGLPVGLFCQFPPLPLSPSGTYASRWALVVKVAILLVGESFHPLSGVLAGR